jgi:uncharacterized membrane protein YfcA
MPSTAIACGTILILIGILGAIAGNLHNNFSPTALIPAVFGVLLAACGFIAWKKESLRKHLMHAAVLIALLGFIGGLFSLRGPIMSGQMGDVTSLTAKIAMAAVCLLFVILGIKSFIDARRNRVGAA